MTKKNINEVILPSFLILLKDNDTDIRIKLLNNIEHITEVIDINTLI